MVTLGWVIAAAAGLRTILWGAEAFSTHLTSAADALRISPFVLAMLVGISAPPANARITSSINSLPPVSSAQRKPPRSRAPPYTPPLCSPVYAFDSVRFPHSQPPPAATDVPVISADGKAIVMRPEPGGPEHFLRVLNHELAPSKVFTTGRGLKTLVKAGLAQPRRVPRLAAESFSLVKQEIARERLRHRRRSVRWRRPADQADHHRAAGWPTTVTRPR